MSRSFWLIAGVMLRLVERWKEEEEVEEAELAEWWRRMELGGDEAYRVKDEEREETAGEMEKQGR